jgi:hypothetical protein
MKTLTKMVTALTILLTLAAVPVLGAGNNGGLEPRFVTGGGWIGAPLGADIVDLPFLNGSYYELVDVDPPVGWFEARDLASGRSVEGCREAHLVTITSAVEQSVVDGLVADLPSPVNVWIGGFQQWWEPREMSLDLNWQWITGEPFVYENWALGEPNDKPDGVNEEPGEEQWLEIVEEGKWNDAPIEPKHYYIVEYEDCPRATFSINAKIKVGAEDPTGSTSFRFPAGDLAFHSTSYDYLRIPGIPGRAAVFLKGWGTVNGEGGYRFNVNAGDGWAPGGADTFRITIWEENGDKTVIFDSGYSTGIGGGNIVVH